jgi:hypothetical protein
VPGDILWSKWFLVRFCAAAGSGVGSLRVGACWFVSSEAGVWCGVVLDQRSMFDYVGVSLR